MAEISAAQVKALRELTNMPMMKCKEALKEAGGDQEKAVEFLKQQSKGIMEKRAENPTSEGRIFIKITDDASKAAMVEIQCESEPVGRGSDLGAFGEQCVAQLLEGPGAETPEALLAQEAPGGGKTLQDQYDDMVGTIREKIVVARCMTCDGPVGGYVHHDGKTAVLMQAEGDNPDGSILRDVAMHIAAMRPVVCEPEELDAATVKAERDKLSEEARATGKPENIIEKIVDGRMNNFYVEEGVLTLQPFAKDDTKNVSQALAEHGLKAKAFHRWVIGL